MIKHIFWMLILIHFGVVQSTYARVSMGGTRVVFPAEQKDQTLHFSNKDQQPHSVQVWTDRGNLKSTPETADGPFSAHPAIFRLDANKGQKVRLFYTGNETLPTDKESIFYLNFKQIPALKKNTIDENQLVLVVSSRFKIFYRPKTIIGSIEGMPERLTFNIVKEAGKDWLEINNPTGFYANLTQALIKTGNENKKIANVDMVAPFSKAKWPIINNTVSVNTSAIIVTLVNDHGAFIHYDLKK